MSCAFEKQNSAVQFEQCGKSHSAMPIHAKDL